MRKPIVLLKYLCGVKSRSLQIASEGPLSKTLPARDHRPSQLSMIAEKQDGQVQRSWVDWIGGRYEALTSAG
jgi:hypothetical protein